MGRQPAQLALAAKLIVVQHLHVEALAPRLLLGLQHAGCAGQQGRITALWAELALQAALERLQSLAAPRRTSTQVHPLMIKSMWFFVRRSWANSQCTLWQLHQVTQCRLSTSIHAKEIKHWHVDQRIKCLCRRGTFASRLHYTTANDMKRTC